MQWDALGPHMPLTCAGGCTVGMGWSKDVKADMADISTSSLTKMFPCTRVWIKGDGGTVMYVEICWKKKRCIIDQQQDKTTNKK